MSKADVFLIFDAVQTMFTERNTRPNEIKEEVFINSENDTISNLQKQIDELKENMAKSCVSYDESDSETASYSSDAEPDPEENVFFAKRTPKPRNLTCSLCKSTNHATKSCKKWQCRNCKGFGHDIAVCPSYKNAQKRSKNKHNQGI